MTRRGYLNQLEIFVMITLILVLAGLVLVTVWDSSAQDSQ